ncbi:carbohydrate ABC transporter permease [Aggregatilinea lenta]|uniref:carbohydrate ABC transporter permease n=1 Tax=Aggregatilinea lenta TaxID=913108 RepID=UPI0013C2E7EB|nr:sugar ABC transporter permease [Aggregatilinea lenta]
MAFQEVTLGTLARGERPFIGLENFRNVFDDPAFFTALQNSLIFTTASVFFQFLIGMALALVLNEVFPLRHIFRGLLLSGWRIPPIVSGTVFLWLFNYDFGFVNFFLMKTGLTSEPVRWLLDQHYALATVIITNIWLGIPFNIILLASGLTGLPEDIYEAATVDGANHFQKLRFMTLPLMKPTILATLMLGFIYTLRVFDVIWVMTGGGPVNATEVLPTLAYRDSFNRFNFGEGAAISVIMLCMLCVVALFYVRTTNDEVM